MSCASGAHGSALVPGFTSLPALGGCHVSVGGTDDRSHDSCTGGAAFDNQGSVTLCELFPFRVLFDADPLFWSQPSVEEPELTEGD